MRFLSIGRMSIQRIVTDPKAYLFGFILLQAIRWIIALPIITYLFHLLLRTAGLESITNSNAVQLLASPITIVLLVVLLFLFTFFAFYEWGYYFLLAHHQRSGLSFTFRTIINELNAKLPKFFSINSIIFSLYFIILLPIVSLGMSTSWTDSLKIPYFITDEVANTPTGQMLLIMCLAIITFINVRLIFSFLYFATNRELSIWGAVVKS